MCRVKALDLLISKALLQLKITLTASPISVCCFAGSHSLEKSKPCLTFHQHNPVLYFLYMQMCYILKVFFNAKSKAKFFFIKTNGSCAHAVSMRCALEQTAVSSTLSRVLPPFGRGSLKLAIPSELEKSRLQCLHRSFSQKHRHHNWDDLEVPLSNKGLRSTALSWDNHLYTLVCHEAAQVSFGFQSVQLLVMTPTFT